MSGALGALTGHELSDGVREDFCGGNEGVAVEALYIGQAGFTLISDTHLLDLESY